MYKSHLFGIETELAPVEGSPARMAAYTVTLADGQTFTGRNFKLGARVEIDSLAALENLWRFLELTPDFSGGINLYTTLNLAQFPVEWNKNYYGAHFMIPYRLHGGMGFHLDTPDRVCEILADYRARRQHRLDWDYGDRFTGKFWGKGLDEQGYIGRSTGNVKIPLCIPNARSTGGSGILDNRIVRIRTARGKRLLWQAPGFERMTEDGWHDNVGDPGVAYRVAA